MSQAFKAACIQLTSGPDIAANLEAAEGFVRRARAAGSEIIFTPETSDLMEPDRARLLEKAKPEAAHQGLARFRALAAELGCWISVGSFLVGAAPEDGPAGKPANRSFLLAPDGAIAARYDKIHMFDVEIPDGQSYRESDRFAAGGRAMLHPLPWGPIGLTICYDMRFAALYRELAQAGALFLTAPSAFTRFTGEAHWHALLRARAIECGAYMFAAAQCGTHPGGRQTYGHSLIVGPWGEVLADGGEVPGYVMAEIEPEKALAARRAIPALSGTRAFHGPRAEALPTPPGP